VITILKAPPFATVQDRGRWEYRSIAVPPSGAMDPEALERANHLAGNAPGAAAIEWGIGAGRLRLSPALDAAVAGAHVIARRERDELIVESFRAGAWAYVAVAGGVDVPEVLGSRSTCLPGRFGGLEGRLLRTGDVLKTGSAPAGRARIDTAPVATRQEGTPFHVLPGPDLALVGTALWEDFLEAEWTVSRAVSRAGYRLDGPALPFEAAPELPSVPVCPGTVQLPPGGRPIVLMPDGPTVGGYPRIAVLISSELGRFAQRRPGERVRFVPP
jgi:biotin-dependent carboxylase-like uncharacterized protein